MAAASPEPSLPNNFFDKFDAAPDAPQAAPPAALNAVGGSAGTSSGNFFDQFDGHPDAGAPSIPPLPAQPAPPAKQGGIARNIGAALNENLVANPLGAPNPVDVATSGLNQLAEVKRRLNEALAPSMQKYASQPGAPIDNPFGGAESIKSGLGAIGANPNDVGVNNWQDAAGRSIGTGMAGMLGPYAAGRAMIARGVDSGLPGAAARLFGGPAPADAGIARTALGAAGNAAIGAGAGAAGYGAEAMLPEGSQYRPLANFGGQMAGGGVVAGGLAAAKGGINYGAGMLRDVLGPMRQGSLEEIVGNKLQSAASDPAALARNLPGEGETPPQPLVPGSMPTTFQASGDQGIGRLQGTLNQEPFQARA
jgi:hypothetical protein